MRTISIFAAAMVWGIGPAIAAPVCASQADMKHLQAAILEQALAASAQSCHMSADYGRFVALYHDGMVASDQSLKAFFAHQSVSEGYERYKARVAAVIADKSLHDPLFCAKAGRLFAVALKRDYGTAPRLMATGYEACAVPQAPLKTATLQNSPALAMRAAPAPSPLIAPLAKTSLALARIPVPRPRIAPPQLALAKPKPAQAAAGKTVLTKTAAIKPAAAMPKKFTWRALDAKAPAVLPPIMPVSAQSTPGTQNAVRHAASENSGPYRADDPVPNAYKPGAVWVVRDSNASPYRNAHMERSPDGHWILVTGRAGEE